MESQWIIYERRFSMLIYNSIFRPNYIKSVTITALCCWLCIHLMGCSVHRQVRTIEAYRNAKKQVDYEKAATYLKSDAIVWFDKKEGPGHPLRAKGGPYTDWDKVFRAKSTHTPYEMEGLQVSYISSETNDFYRLLDSVPGKMRITYFFDNRGKISGKLIQGLKNQPKRPTGRRKEFTKWAATKYPGLLDTDEMKIPNQPRRWRELLIEWRTEIGLPPIE